MSAFPVVAALAQDPSAKAAELERRGDFPAAADAYRAVLAQRPADLAALLGLERSLRPLGRLPDMLPQIDAAYPSALSLGPVYAIGIRVWMAAGRADSARALVDRWAAIDPADDTPYREWGQAFLDRRDRAGAKEAYLEGRRRLGTPDALAAELAEIAGLEGDYATAVREWLKAIQAVPGYRMTAAVTLAEAPPPARVTILGTLDAAGTPVAQRLAADLAARFGDPVGGFRRLRVALPDDQGQAVDLLRQFVEQIRGQATPDASRAQGMALEAMADRLAPGPAARARLEAAQAYSDAGDRDAARRLLNQVADNPDGASRVSGNVVTTLVSLLLDEGKVDEAERRLDGARGSMSADTYDGLRRKVLLARVRRGELARVDSILAADSTVEGLDLAGRVSLYRGDLALARSRLTAAGPFAGTRAQATERAALLALIQPIQLDSLPALGAALLALNRGDSAAAVGGLLALAGTLPPTGGGGELTLMAGRIEAARGRNREAEELFRAADIPDAPATGAAAELELARLLMVAGRTAEAIDVLEHLVVTYPGSAIAPQARRLLDVARGAVPRT